MTSIFLQILELSGEACTAVAVVLIARLALRWAPRRFSYLLWTAVLWRLLCPLRIEIPILAAVPMHQTGTAVFVGTPGWVTIGAYVWLAGMLGMTAFSAVRWLRLQRRMRRAVWMGENLYCIAGLDTAFVAGMFRPKIYLPDGLSDSERRMVCAHEQAHIAHGDMLWRALAFTVLVIHWFNPLVWLAFLLSGQDMELACDERVLRTLDRDSRADYAACLLRFSTKTRANSAVFTAFGAGNVKGRIKHMVKIKSAKPWVLVLAALVCAAVLVGCGTEPVAQEMPEVPNTTEPAPVEQVQQDVTPTDTDTVPPCGDADCTEDHAYLRLRDDCGDITEIYEAHKEALECKLLHIRIMRDEDHCHHHD